MFAVDLNHLKELIKSEYLSYKTRTSEADIVFKLFLKFLFDKEDPINDLESFIKYYIYQTKLYTFEEYIEEGETEAEMLQRAYANALFVDESSKLILMQNYCKDAMS